MSQWWDRFSRHYSTIKRDSLIPITSAKSIYWTADELVGKGIQIALFGMTLSMTDAIRLTHDHQLWWYQQFRYQQTLALKNPQKSKVTDDHSTMLLAYSVITQMYCYFWSCRVDHCDKMCTVLTRTGWIIESTMGCQSEVNVPSSDRLLPSNTACSGRWWIIGRSWYSTRTKRTIPKIVICIPTVWVWPEDSRKTCNTM